MFGHKYVIDAVNAKGLREFVAGLGLDIDCYARSVGIDPAVLGESGQRISLTKYAALLESLAAATGDDTIGLQLGEAYTLGDAGIFGLAFINAPTVGHAVYFYEQYLHLIVDSPFHDLAVDEKQVTVSWSYWPIIPAVNQFVDFRAILFCRVLRRIVGNDWYPSSVRLIRAAPRDPRLHRKLLSPQIEFAARMNCVIFPSSLMQVKSPNGDPRIFDFLVQACARESEQLRKSSDLLHNVEHHIMSGLPTRSVSLEWVAAKVNVSERTLQRKLKSRQVTMESLTDAIRRQLSDQLLTEQKLPMEEIGFLCGYSSFPAYSRAAKRWYGEGPAARRRSLLRRRS